MRLQKITILTLTLAGFALRLHYLTTTHPFFDEYTTVLAARQILRHGWPVLPSGLFYEHGLLATFVTAPFTALFIDTPLSQWQPAHWRLMLSRWPSLLIGTATIPIIFAIGRRYLSSGPALLAAGLFALSPEGMVWGGRARMYALATLLVLLAVFWAYRGARYPAPARYRWWAWLALLATLLTQLGALILIPPLVIAMLLAGRLSWPPAIGQGQKNATGISRPWFLRPTIFLEGATLAAVVGLALWIKRLGRPLGAAALSSPKSGPLLAELFNTITYQTAFHFTWADTVKFLSRQFGVPHHFWLALLTLAGALIGLALWLVVPEKTAGEERQPLNWFPRPSFNLFLWLIFGLIILETVTLLDPFRRNPRYLVIYLPLFYLIAANAIFNFRHIPKLMGRTQAAGSSTNLASFATSTIPALALLILFTLLGFNDLRLALVTPEPAYEEALAWLEAEARPDDLLLTMNTPAAGLYLGQADGFTVQNEADQFLLEAGSEQVDRWLGAPWLGTAADFNAALNTTNRAWFVIDTIRLPVYFQGDWLAVLNSQMEQAWAGDNALIYRTRPDRRPIPTGPETLIKATLGDSIELIGYALQLQTPQSPILNPQTPSSLQLTLFWQPLTPLSIDYTTFLHLRNQEGVTVAQRDSQPLDGTYPTGRWRPGETVIDPITFPLPADLPAGRYDLFTGLYRLDTLERLPVANDTSGENAIFLGEVRLP